MKQIYTREIILNTFQKEDNKILIITHTKPEDISHLTIPLTHTKEDNKISVIQHTPSTNGNNILGIQHTNPEDRNIMTIQHTYLKEDNKILLNYQQI